MSYTNDFPNLANVTQDGRAGRMLTAGDVRVTVTSKSTGRHITVRFKAFAKNGRWERVPLAEATHLFIEVPNQSESEYGNDKVGTFYPDRVAFYRDDNCSDARYWAARNAALWLLGEECSDQATYLEENRCGVCARTLTDPVSIRRGIGPTCYGQGTGSEHETKVRDDQMSLEGEFLEDEDLSHEEVNPDESSPTRQVRLSRQALKR